MRKSEAVRGANARALAGQVLLNIMHLELASLERRMRGIKWPCWAKWCTLSSIISFSKSPLRESQIFDDVQKLTLG